MKSPTTTMTHKPKFYDIADYVVDGYDQLGSIPSELGNEADVRTGDYIIKYNLQTGDVIFTGSTYETRQEYGFYMVDRSKSDLLISNEGYYGAEDENDVKEFTMEYAGIAGVLDLDFTDVVHGVTDLLGDFGSI